MIYSKKDIELIRAITLDQYFASERPEDLIDKGNGRYDVKYNGEWHTSLSIIPPCEKYPNGYWSFFSQGESGQGALDWLINMEGMNFAAACQALVGPPTDELTADLDGEETRKRIEDKFGQILAVQKSQQAFTKSIEIPKKSSTTANVKAYLTGRKIDPGIVDYSIRQGSVYEDDHKNCVFAGHDMQGFIKYASKRGTGGSDFKGEAKGSDKQYSFRYENPMRTSAHFFEAAIDTMSYATYMKNSGMEWRLENLISLGGIAAKVQNNSGKEEIPADVEGKLPPAMEAFLKRNPKVKTIHLHLDNDLAGRKATAKIKALLEKEGYRVLDEPAPKGKDWNDFITGKTETEEIEHIPEEEEIHGERKLNNTDS